MLSLNQFSKKYDYFWHLLDKYQKEENICGSYYINDIFKCHRSDNEGVDGCCYICMRSREMVKVFLKNGSELCSIFQFGYLSRNGCRVKNLCCKASLCYRRKWDELPLLYTPAPKWTKVAMDASKFLIENKMWNIFYTSKTQVLKVYKELLRMENDTNEILQINTESLLRYS